MVLDCFRKVWLVDFEYRAPDGERPEPICMVVREFKSGWVRRYWLDDLATMSEAPFTTGPDSLFCAYFASAELICFLVLGWLLPSRVLDLFVEFRNVTNGEPPPCGNSLLGALMYHGIDSMAAAEKEDLRTLAMRGGPYTASEKIALLDYCQSDVDALAKLLPRMLPRIDLPHALLRGRSMAAVARMEFTGVPIDTGTLRALRANWPEIQRRITREIDKNYGVFVPTGSRSLSFSQSRWASWLAVNNIPWPCLDSGRLDLKDETFRQMARRHPEVASMRELRYTLSQLRLNDLAVGSDSRNRCLLSPFQARTSRNQPSNSKFIFGPSCWLRGLIKPDQGRAVAYVDWEQQEFGIAAALSGDEAMIQAYTSGDPYLTFAKQAGAVPADATKTSHPRERETFKICALAVQYGMGPKSLAKSLGEPEALGRELLRLHQRTYRRFWAWSEAAVNHAMLRGRLHTVFGWRILVGPKSNPRSLANFPMQANGAEMLRLACCLATERGIQVCAPIHDAVLVEADADEIESTVTETQGAMAEASRIVLGGFGLRSDANIVRYPERYMDPRGERMWSKVIGILDELDPTGSSTGATAGVAPMQL